MRAWFTLSLSLWTALAAASPVQLHHQARLLDGVGAPRDGQLDLTVRLWDEESGGAAPVWFDDYPDHPVQGGYVDLVLGAGKALDSGAFSGPRWVELVVEGQVLAPRQRLAEVPYAAGASGAFALGTAPDGACATGGLRWNASAGRAELCVGGAWHKVLTAPIVAASCAEVLALDPSRLGQDGVYTIDPDGEGPAPEQGVVCDMSTDDGGWTLVAARGSANGVGNTTSTLQSRLSATWGGHTAQSVPIDLWMGMVGSTWSLLSKSTHSATTYRHDGFADWGASVPWVTGQPCAQMVVNLGGASIGGVVESNLGFLNNYPSGCTAWSYQYRAFGLAGNTGGHIHATNSYAFGLYPSENGNTQTHMFSRDAGKMSVYGTGDLAFFIR